MVLETQSLTKYYGNKIGCKDISISVGKGEIFGFLGPNGAGKSTFIKMLVGLIFPTAGNAYILGKPIGNVDIRRKIGYLPENFKYQDWMTGVDLLSFHACLYKLDGKKAGARIDEVLYMVNLKGQEKYKVGSYSKGMQQRIGLACALLPEPDLLFLDEPTSALDPVGRKEVREIMLDLKAQGKTVLLNSHLLSEVEMVCDSASIINRGSVIKYGRMDDILEGKIILEIRAQNINDSILSELIRFDPHLTHENDRLKLRIDNSDDIHNIAYAIIENGGRLYELTPRKDSLENVFISLVRKGETR